MESHSLCSFCLSSFNIIILKFIQVVVNIESSFLKNFWVAFHHMEIANLSTHLEKDIWVVSSLRVFQINLLWTRMCKSVYEHMFSFVLDKYLGVQWLDSVVGMCLNFKKLSYPLAVYDPVHCSTLLSGLLIHSPSFPRQPPQGLEGCVSSWSWFPLPWGLVRPSILHVLSCHPHISSVDMSVGIFCLYLNKIFQSCCWVVKVLYIFNTQVLWGICVL